MNSPKSDSPNSPAPASGKSPAARFKSADGASSIARADASPDPRWPYLNRWSGNNTSLAATIGEIENSAKKAQTLPPVQVIGPETIPASVAVDLDPPEVVRTKEKGVADLLPQTETCTFSPVQSSQVGDLTKPITSQIIDGSAPEVVSTESAPVEGSVSGLKLRGAWVNKLNLSTPPTSHLPSGRLGKSSHWPSLAASNPLVARSLWSHMGQNQ